MARGAISGPPPAGGPSQRGGSLALGAGVESSGAAGDCVLGARLAGYSPLESRESASGRTCDRGFDPRRQAPGGMFLMMTRAEILDTLSGTPNRVEVLAHGLSSAQLTERPKASEWSMGEILNHLLVGERDVIFRRFQ